MTTTNEIAARNAARTQGEWRSDYNPWGTGSYVKCGGVDLVAVNERLAHISRAQCEANATFIAHAPADITHLLAENQRLKDGWQGTLDDAKEIQAEVERLREALRPFAEAWATKLLWDADSTARHPHLFSADTPCNSDPAAAMLWKWDAFKAAHDALEVKG